MLLDLRRRLVHVHQARQDRAEARECINARARTRAHCTHLARRVSGNRDSGAGNGRTASSKALRPGQTAMHGYMPSLYARTWEAVCWRSAASSAASSCSIQLRIRTQALYVS